MNYTQIESEIENQKSILKGLQSQVSRASILINKLVQEKSDLEFQYFKDYLQIGYKFTFKSYTCLKGVPTGKNNTDSPYFYDGDIIEIVKKNEKSIVVKCINKQKTQIIHQNGVKVNKVSQYSPNNNFRIDIDSLMYNFQRNKEFKNSFKTWIKRQISLDVLGV